MEEVLWKTAEPIKIKIEKGQRGGIGWEISIKGDDADAILSQLQDIHSKLQKQYSEEVNNA